MGGPTPALACPMSLGSEEPGADPAPGAGSDRSDNSAFLLRESKKPARVDIPGVDGGGCAVPNSLAETALARKFKHPKGLKCHHTFRIGAHHFLGNS